MDIIQHYFVMGKQILEKHIHYLIKIQELYIIY